jgi:acyl carrier protein
MDLNEFVAKFAEQFENTDSASFKPGTVFKDLDEWSSLIALSILAMIFEEYKIKLAGEDIRSSATIEDLFSRVQAKG